MDPQKRRYIASFQIGAQLGVWQSMQRLACIIASAYVRHDERLVLHCEHLTASGLPVLHGIAFREGLRRGQGYKEGDNQEDLSTLKVGLKWYKLAQNRQAWRQLIAPVGT